MRDEDTIDREKRKNAPYYGWVVGEILKSVFFWGGGGGIGGYLLVLQKP